jgi:hypothetical protein
MEKFIAIFVAILVAGLFMFFARLMILHHVRKLKPMHVMYCNIETDKIEIHLLINPDAEICSNIPSDWKTIKTFDTIEEANIWWKKNII